MRVPQTQLPVLTFPVEETRGILEQLPPTQGEAHSHHCPKHRAWEPSPCSRSSSSSSRELSGPSEWPSGGALSPLPHDEVQLPRASVLLRAQSAPDPPPCSQALGLGVQTPHLLSWLSSFSPSPGLCRWRARLRLGLRVPASAPRQPHHGFTCHPCVDDSRRYSFRFSWAVWCYVKRNAPSTPRYLLAPNRSPPQGFPMWSKTASLSRVKLWPKLEGSLTLVLASHPSFKTCSHYDHLSPPQPLAPDASCRPLSTRQSLRQTSAAWGPGEQGPMVTFGFKSKAGPSPQCLEKQGRPLHTGDKWLTRRLCGHREL